jgi:hypothetical protein
VQQSPEENRAMFRRLFAVCVLVAACTLPAAASERRDVVHFGNNIVVGEDENAGDLVCFLCSVEAKGNVQGDIVVFLGSVHLDQGSRGNMVVFGGDVWLNGDASIGHDLVLFGGTLHPAERQRVGGETVIFPPIIFLPILLVIAAILWGIWMVASWLIHGRRGYYPLPPPPPRR